MGIGNSSSPLLPLSMCASVSVSFSGPVGLGFVFFSLGSLVLPALSEFGWGVVVDVLLSCLCRVAACACCCSYIGLYAVILCLFPIQIGFGCRGKLYLHGLLVQVG